MYPEWLLASFVTRLSDEAVSAILACDLQRSARKAAESLQLYRRPHSKYQGPYTVNPKLRPYVPRSALCMARSAGAMWAKHVLAARGGLGFRVQGLGSC